MCEKAVVLEIKDDYCLAMTEDGRVVRIRKKAGVREGQKIYILEEDLYDVSESVKGAAVLPFFGSEKKSRSGNRDRRKEKAVLTKVLTAAAAVLIFAGTLSLPQITDPAYASVSFDGEKSVQLKLDDENRVLSAKSYDGTVEADVLSDMEGRSLEQLWDVLSDFSEPDEPLLVAGAPVKRGAEENADALEEEICRNLKGENLFLRGEKEDVRQAEKQNKSLGLYLLEKAVDEDILAEYFDDEQDEKLAEFLKKYQDKMPQIYRKYVKLSETDRDDAQDFEPEEDDRDEGEANDDRDEEWDDEENERPGSSVNPQEPDDEDDEEMPSAGEDEDDKDETGESDEDEEENEEESRDEQI